MFTWIGCCFFNVSLRLGSSSNCLTRRRFGAVASLDSWRKKCHPRVKAILWRQDRMCAQTHRNTYSASKSTCGKTRIQPHTSIWEHWEVCVVSSLFLTSYFMEKILKNKLTQLSGDNGIFFSQHPTKTLSKRGRLKENQRPGREKL